MIVGKFGNKIFEVSMKRMITFNGITMNLGLDYENQEIENSKPATWVKGKKLKEVTIPITLDHRFCNIKSEMQYWETALDKVSGGNLSIGEWVVGYFIVTGISYSNYRIGGNGRYQKVDVEVTLQEFVSKGYNKDKPQTTAAATSTPTTVTKPPTTYVPNNTKAATVKSSQVQKKTAKLADTYRNDPMIKGMETGRGKANATLGIAGAIGKKGVVRKW